MALVRLTRLDALPPGAKFNADANGTPVVLVNDAGALHAFRDECPHRNAPLSAGNFVDGRLICPWHAWEFICATGCYDYSSDIQLTRLPVVVQAGDIYVDA